MSAITQKMRFACGQAGTTIDLTLWAGYNAYFLAFLGLYVFAIIPVFHHLGFVDAFSSTNLLVSLVLIAVVMPGIRPNGLPSGFFLNLAGILILIPTLVIYTGSGLPHRYPLVSVGGIVLIAFVARTAKLRPLRVPGIRASWLVVGLGCIAAATIAAIFAYGGGKFMNFDFANVYDIRRDAAGNLPRVFGYLNPAIAGVGIPFAIALALVYRRWLSVALLGFLSLMFFALTAHKSPLLYPLIVIAVYALGANRYIATYLLGGVLIGLTVSALDLWMAIQEDGGWPGWVGGLFARRALLVPSFLNWCYLDYFADAEKYYWAGSSFSFGLAESPSGLRAVNVIAGEYFGHPENAANTGWIGAGYANAGLVGIGLYSVLIGGLFSWIDGYARLVGSRIITAIFVVPVVLLFTSADLPTMLLTHGLAFCLILVALATPSLETREGLRW